MERLDSLPRLIKWDSIERKNAEGDRSAAITRYIFKESSLTVFSSKEQFFIQNGIVTNREISLENGIAIGVPKSFVRDAFKVDGCIADTLIISGISDMFDLILHFQSDTLKEMKFVSN